MTDNKRAEMHQAGIDLLNAILESDSVTDELHDCVANALVLLDDGHTHPAELTDAALAYAREITGRTEGQA